MIGDWLFFLIYQGLMAYGIVALAVFWISPPSAGALGVGEIPYVVLAVGVPLFGWFLTIWQPWCCLMIPLSLGTLYYRARREDARAREQESSSRLAELSKTERTIRHDPSNAAAHQLKAEILEKRGDHEQALWHYHRAHALSERMLPASEMRDIEERLAQDKGKKSSAGSPGLETVFLAVGFVYFLFNWTCAVNVTSVLLFLRWMRSRADS